MRETVPKPTLIFMHTRVPEIKSLMSLKTVPKLDTHSATVLHLLRQPVHRRGSDSNHGLGLDTLSIDTHEQNFIRRLLPLELELLLSCTTTKTPNTWKRYPIPSHSKWRLKNIYSNTLNGSQMLITGTFPFLRLPNPHTNIPRASKNLGLFR